MTSEALVKAVLPDTEAVLAIHEVELAPVPLAVSDARRFVRDHAPELPDDTEDALLLLTSELVTNAVLHARTQIIVGIVVADESVVVTVHDLDLAVGDQDPYRHNREGGWGLGLVRALAQSAAMSTHPEGGKTAWFRLLRQPAGRVPEAAAARDDAERRDS